MWSGHGRLIGVSLAEDLKRGGGGRDQHQVRDDAEPERDSEREPEPSREAGRIARPDCVGDHAERQGTMTRKPAIIQAM